jgi:tetratricopeptide (TPR) repeat protein
VEAPVTDPKATTAQKVLGTKTRSVLDIAAKALYAVACLSVLGVIVWGVYHQKDPASLIGTELKTFLVLLVVLLLLPSLKTLEGFGVKLEVVKKVEEKVDALSGPVRALPDYIQGSDYLQEEDLSMAELFFQRSLSQDPTFPPALVSLGSIAHQQHDYDKAVRLYRQAWELGSTNVYAANNLADLYMELSNPVEALLWADRALKEVPTMASALYYKAEALNRLGRYQEALPLLTRIQQGNGIPGELHWVLYEQCVASSHLGTRLTAASLEKLLFVATNNGGAVDWLRVAEVEQERFDKEDRETLLRLLEKHRMESMPEA